MNAAEKIIAYNISEDIAVTEKLVESGKILEKEKKSNGTMKMQLP